jgi:chloramphenicol-sensitive protein RarD
MKSEQFKGSLEAIISFLLWGFIPIYWKFLHDVPAEEILIQRIFWSLILLSSIITYKNLWRAFFKVFEDLKTLKILFISTLCIGINWYVFIWAVKHNHILQTGLGYFMNPLLNVVIGVLLLGERPNKLQWLAIFLAFLGVSYLSFSFGALPWISLSLAFSFGFYGYLRKLAGVNTFVGLQFETIILFILSLLFLLGDHFFHFLAVPLEPLARFSLKALSSPDTLTIALLISLSGIATTTPMIFFNMAASKLPLTMLGLFQYIAPSCQIFLAVFFYDEIFTSTHGVTFGLIWSALIIFSLERVKNYQRHKGQL